MQYKIFSVFFALILILSIASFVSAQESSITTRVNKVEISPDAITTEAEPCAMPACKGAYETGEYYNNGCPVFECPKSGDKVETCPEIPIPRCPDYYVSEYDENGCPLKYSCPPVEKEKIELILEKQYEPGEKIQIKVKNNLKRTIYYIASGFGARDNAYVIYRLYSYYKKVPVVKPDQAPGSQTTAQGTGTIVVGKTAKKIVSSQVSDESETSTEDSGDISWTSDVPYPKRPVTVRKLTLLNYCLPCPTIYLIKEIKPGETVVIDTWNQLEFEKKCPSSGTQTGKQVSNGNYQINFRYSEKEEDFSDEKTIARKFKIFSCPENCTCGGNDNIIISCQRGREVPVSAGIVSRKGEIKTIKIKKVSEKEISIESTEAVEVLPTTTTSQKIIVENNKLYTEISTGKKQIILPEEAANEATENMQVDMGSVKSIELKEEDNKPVYYVKGAKKVKIISVIPATMKIKTKVNAENGEIISIKKSWWSFLAK